jgi:hypothetical protein
MQTRIYTLVLPILLLSSCVIYYAPCCDDNLAPTRNRNVCAHLKDSVILYAIFVDTDAFHPFTEYDILSTMDSISKACRWLMDEAGENQIPLSVRPVMHAYKNKWSFHESKVYAEYSTSKVYSGKRRHINFMNGWMDAISRHVYRGLKRETSTHVARRANAQKNTEGVIARLRDAYKTDNIALMVFVNGYYEEDMSASFNTYGAGPNVEFSLITKKNPAVIAHEFLHLFGAVDLYPTDYHSNFNAAEIAEMYPDEIMRIQHKPVNELMLSPITKYYIGWTDSISKPDTRLLYHKSNVLAH